MRSLLLLVSDDVKTDCVETGLPRNICSGARGNRRPYWNTWSTKGRGWFCVVLSVLDRNFPHRGVLQWLELWLRLVYSFKMLKVLSFLCSKNTRKHYKGCTQRSVNFRRNAEVWIVVTGKICVRFRVNYVSLYFIELTFKLAMNATSSSGDEGNVDKGNSILLLGYLFQSRQMFSVS